MQKFFILSKTELTCLPRKLLFLDEKFEIWPRCWQACLLYWWSWNPQNTDKWWKFISEIWCMTQENIFTHVEVQGSKGSESWNPAQLLHLIPFYIKARSPHVWFQPSRRLVSFHISLIHNNKFYQNFTWTLGARVAFICLQICLKAHFCIVFFHLWWNDTHNCFIYWDTKENVF